MYIVINLLTKKYTCIVLKVDRSLKNAVMLFTQSSINFTYTGCRASVFSLYLLNFQVLKKLKHNFNQVIFTFENCFYLYRVYQFFWAPPNFIVLNRTLYIFAFFNCTLKIKASLLTTYSPFQIK